MHHFSALLAAQQRIAECEPDADAILDQVGALALAMLGADGAWVALQEGGSFACRSAHGTAASLIGETLGEASGCLPCVTQGETLLRFDDGCCAPQVDPTVRERLGIRSLVATAFHLEGCVAGSLAVIASRPGAFGDDDAQTLQLLAGMLASALRHAANDLVTEAVVTERTAALVALQAIDESLQHLIHSAPVGLCIVDEGGVIEVVNGACCALFGYDRAELIGLPLTAIMPTGRSAGASSAPTRDQIQTDIVTRPGGRRTILASMASIMGADGSPRRAAFFVDITARHQAERALQRERDFTTAILETAGCLVAILDDEGRIVRVNRAFEAITGFERAELLGRDLRDLFVRQEDDGLPAQFADLRAGPEPREHESYLMTKHAELRLIAWSTTTLAGDGTGRVYVLCTGIDITARKQAEEQLTRLAHYDALTGLPNRVLFVDRLSQVLLAAPRLGKPASLLLIDLDHFKEVNDTLGHDAGDLLLRHVGRRLQAAIRRSDTAARLGGDEFAVLLPATDQAGAEMVAEKILDALSAPVILDGPTVHVGGSVGIAVAPDHGQDTGTLLRHADVAMYLAKRRGGGTAVYTADADDHSTIRLTLGGELRHAIARGELRLHYQPVVSLGDADFLGVEALVRWQHPTHGLLSPGEFIGLAEQTGLIIPLTKWVLEEAIRQCSRWHAQGLRCGVAVNLSARSLGDDQIATLVATLLERHGLPPCNLTLELTETVVMAQPERAIAVLSQLSALGVRIAIDDFGTGQSSLSYLQRLPVHELKIDRSFVSKRAASDGTASIVPFIMGLGHSLGLGIVVEGVESEETWQQLSALSCDAVQGYYVSRPLPPDELERWLQARPDAGSPLMASAS